MLPVEKPREVAGSRSLRETLAAWLGRDPSETLRICGEALNRYKLRTTLSVLGVILGVGGVIAVMSVSQGARDEILRQVELLGLDNIVVRDLMPGGAERLELRDATRLTQLVPTLKHHSPLVEKSAFLFGPEASRSARLIGVHADYRAILHLQTAKGRFLSVIDDRSLARVCVLGYGLAADLFGFEEPVGRSIRVSGEWYRVVGVLGRRSAHAPGATSLAWRDLNQSAIVPLSAFLSNPDDAAPSTPVQELWLQIDEGEKVVEVGRVVEQTLQKLHRDAAGLSVVVPRALMEQRLRAQSTFSVVVGSIATLTLIVGGIGIMNIMLASVLERTREIGLLRAVGATRNDVKIQFLTEALLLTLAGGIAGILLGILISLSISAYAGWAVRVSVEAIVLAFLVSVATGLAFGFYPALKAARLPPIDALRYE